MAESSLMARREPVMDTVNRALDAAWPHRQGKEFVDTLRSAAAELAQIADRMVEVGAPPIEQSRTDRYRGSVLSDLAPALGKGMLEQARSAYATAEQLLEGCDDPMPDAIPERRMVYTHRGKPLIDPYEHYSL